MSKKDGKITLGMIKGKPATTSVPSVTIKFHANAEQLEELYGIRDEDVAITNDTESICISSNEAENTTNTPLKLLPDFVKRSTSIDISPNTSTSVADISPPPSDPWRFFSNIKGKITKSVEDKLTEIKSRNQENDGSPSKQNVQIKPEENSSISDSEDLSESSISKTCGVFSTTEGVEMSSDDDVVGDDDNNEIATPSLEKDIHPPSSIGGLRQRFCLLKNKSPLKESSFSKTTLSQLYNINAEDAEAITLNNDEDIEHGIEALETETSELIKSVVECIDNISVSEKDTINIQQVDGEHMKFYENKLIFAPTGFVDLRQQQQRKTQKNRLKSMSLIIVLFVAFYLLTSYSVFSAGLLGGFLISQLFTHIKQILFPSMVPLSSQVDNRKSEMMQLPVIKEYQPLIKHQGWVNEYPELYNPHNYHISRTQSVYIKLQGNILRVSHCKNKIGKRALWNEGEIQPIFTHHRIYNLMGAKVLLLPDGLAKKRYWSKKYPICIVLSKDQIGVDINNKCEECNNKEEKIEKESKFKKTFHHFKRKKSPVLAQRFSKLTEEEYELNSDNSRPSSPSPPSPDLSDEQRAIVNEEIFQDASNTTTVEWADNEDDRTKIYIFGRTDREKENWYRRLTAATHYENTLDDDNGSIENEYFKYAMLFNKMWKQQCKNSSDNENMLWLNEFVGRILFDLLHNEEITRRVKDRIERKLSALKLPYFIQQLLVTDLNLGQMPMVIHRASKPILNEKGLWIDLDITYQGLIVLELQTNLNLMKLKQHNEEKILNTERSAMFNSDIDDSAESSSDEDFDQMMTPSSTDTKGKKFIKMVDRITESKIFQAATENRYIKKAMENVSNTDLRLKVELKQLNGCLVVNVPLPPSDRIWLGFRPLPELDFSAHPIVGEKNINFLKVSNWIEKKLLLEFQKLFVIPNMEDLIIPVMSEKLPE